ILPCTSSVLIRPYVSGEAGVRPSNAPQVFSTPKDDPKIGALLISISRKTAFAQFPQWYSTGLFGSSAYLLFHSTNALGVRAASCIAYIVSVPVTSTSQALGNIFSLIILIEVQTLHP